MYRRLLAIMVSTVLLLTGCGQKTSDVAQGNQPSEDELTASLRMNRKNLRRLKAIILLITLLSIIGMLSVYNIPIQISNSVEALEINMADQAYVVPRTVTIEGKYHFNLFSKDVFSGQLTVSGYESFCENRILNDVLISKNGYPLSYQTEDGTADDFYLGRIYAGVFLKDLLIGFVYEDNGEKSSTENCNVIVTGVQTRDDACKRFEDIFYKKQILG